MGRMTMKIKWKIGEKATGSFAAFYHRCWPAGEINEHAAFQIACNDSYSLKLAKSGDHAPLRLFYAKVFSEDMHKKYGRFDWVLVGNYKTLAEAKEAAKNHVLNNKEYFEKYFSVKEDTDESV